jgi:hypothetical protein
MMGITICLYKCGRVMTRRFLHYLKNAYFLCLIKKVRTNPIDTFIILLRSFHYAGFEFDVLLRIVLQLEIY